MQITSGKKARKPKKITAKRASLHISASKQKAMLAAFRKAAFVTEELQIQRRVPTKSLYEQMTL